MAIYSELENKRILITGSTSGIGKKIASDLALQKSNLLLLGRNKEKLDQVSTSLQTTSDLCICDQADLSSIETAMSSITTPLDGVVFCAGVASFLPIKFLKQEKTQEIFNINFFSNVIILQYLIKKKLLRSGSSVVFISSISQYVAETGTSIYSSSKAALSAFARNAALELSPSKIRVNSISPGLVKTELLNDENGLLNEQVLNKNAANYPLGLGLTEDVSSAALFLLSDSSKWMTGSDIKLDGGFCLK